MKLIRESETCWHLYVGDKVLWLSTEQLAQMHRLLNKNRKPMKKRLLDWLKCKLGGATLDECAESNRNSYQMGIYVAHLKMKIYADSMYGITPDEWCRRMYDLITTKIQALEQSAEIMASNQKSPYDADRK